MKSEMEHEVPLVEQVIIEDFCIDERCCEKRLSTPEFPSPTSFLPIDKLAELKREIHAANQLLLNLALDDHRTQEEIFRGAFSGLEGLSVEVALDTGKTVKGKVHTVGSDFVVLLGEKVEILLPYRVIVIVKPIGRFAPPCHEAHLIDIDPCLRRNITFCFGSIVSSSPELLHLFFRMRFNIYLLLLEGKTIEITLGETVIKTVLTDVNKDTIVIKTKDKMKSISSREITMIKITNV